MAKAQKEQFRAPPKKCVYCGQRADKTKDHVPPKSLFLEPLPKQLITVPACSACNGGFSDLDNAFKEWLGFSLGVSNDARNRYWNKKLLPTVRKNQKRRRQIVDELRLVKVAIPNRSVPVEMHALNIDADIQERMISRLVRGLWFREFDEIFPLDAPIEQMLLDRLEDMDEFTKHCNWRHLDNQFSFGFFTDGHRPWTSFWFFLFHGGNFSVAFTREATKLSVDDEHLLDVPT
jgi:hypothetical protein